MDGGEGAWAGGWSDFGRTGDNVIGLYSNRLGCGGSIAVSIGATVLLALLLRGCGLVAW